MTLESVLHAIVLACAAYLAFVYIAYAALALLGIVEGIRRRNQADVEDLTTMSSSRFTPPLSVVLTAYEEESAVVPAAESLLALDYPAFDLIVVNDGSEDGTLARLHEAFDLEPIDIESRDVVPSEPVLACYRSRRDPRLLVVDKDNGGKADALNAGLNFSRHPFVCGVDADSVFPRDGVLRVMREFTRDPGLVGLTGYVSIAGDPARTMSEPAGQRRVDGSPLIGFQVLDYMRAFLTNRVGWSRLHFMLCAIGAFQIWRRDVLDELGGFSREHTCEDIEFTFRVHEHMLRLGKDYRVVCLPDHVATTEGPDTVGKLVSQRERWHRVTLETFLTYRRMFLNPRYGSVGLLGMPFFLATEVLAPVFELATVIVLVLGVAFGLLDWQMVVAVTTAIALLNASLSAAAVAAVETQSRTYRSSSIARLLLLAPFELFLYRPLIAWARVKGTWRTVRHDKSWERFERNTRTVPA